MLIQTTIELDDKNGDIQNLVIEGEYCDHEGVLNFCIEFAGIEFEAEVLTAHFPYTAEQIATMACDAIKEEANIELENAFINRFEFAGDR
jgi:hypothetical protein